MFYKAAVHDSVQARTREWRRRTEFETFAGNLWMTAVGRARPMKMKEPVLPPALRVCMYYDVSIHTSPTCLNPFADKTVGRPSVNMYC
jgi:hypothetical protein